MGCIVYSSWGKRRVIIHYEGCGALHHNTLTSSQPAAPAYDRFNLPEEAEAHAARKARALGTKPQWCRRCQ